MIYKALNHGNTKEWVTAPGYPIVGDPEYVDNDALELDQYGDVLNPYTGGYGPVRIPEVKVYGFKNGAYYPTLAENRTALLIREHNRNKESHRLAYMGIHNGSDEGFEEYYASLPSFAQEGGEKPLESVSPEFDFLLMGGPKLVKKAVEPIAEKGFLLVENYAKNVGDRFLEMKLKPVLPSKINLIKKGFIEDPYTGNFKLYDYTSNYSKGILKKSGGPLIRLRYGTTEVHLTPPAEVTVPMPLSISDYGIIASGKTPHMKTLYSAIQGMPVGTTISSSENAIAPIFDKVTWSFPQKARYVLTGKVPFMKKFVVPGYSTDVYPIMKLLERTGQWVVRPSSSTIMSGTNSLGTNVDLSPFITNRTGDIIKSNNFSLPLPQRDFTINFSNFSPAQVKLWNRTIAPKTGMFIDPKTRTATHYTVTKIR